MLPHGSSQEQGRGKEAYLFLFFLRACLSTFFLARSFSFLAFFRASCSLSLGSFRGDGVPYIRAID